MDILNKVKDNSSFINQKLENGLGNIGKMAGNLGNIASNIPGNIANNVGKTGVDIKNSTNPITSVMNNPINLKTNLEVKNCTISEICNIFNINELFMKKELQIYIDKLIEEEIKDFKVNNIIKDNFTKIIFEILNEGNGKYQFQHAFIQYAIQNDIFIVFVILDTPGKNSIFDIKMPIFMDGNPVSDIFLNKNSFQLLAIS